jgi:hypothetical protein
MRFRYMTAASGVHTLSRISAHTTVAPTGCRAGQSPTADVLALPNRSRRAAVVVLTGLQFAKA